MIREVLPAHNERKDMTKYVITYDLRKPGRNYDGLIAAIKTYAWAKVNESSWFISTNQTPSEVRDKISATVDSGDRLMVTALTGAAAWRNCIASDNDLKTFLTTS